LRKFFWMDAIHAPEIFLRPEMGETTSCSGSVCAFNDC
jgi:hypothetical protein